MAPANLVRGTVLKCNFPYDTTPDQPGPLPHYCLYIASGDADGGERFVAVCYGTSRLDNSLLRTHSGAILSVATQFIGGDKLPGEVTHFVCSHVAILPEDWIYGNFAARLDFVRPDRRQNDPRRQRLYEQFEALERVMARAALDALEYTVSTGHFGLPPGKSLR